jgi:hypothetical protein
MKALLNNFDLHLRQRGKMSVKWLNYRESIGICQLCGKEEELRPYGPSGEWICFDCGMKDETVLRVTGRRQRAEKKINSDCCKIERDK